MKLKENLEFTSDDFWYDLTQGGYLNPEEICENKKDAKKVIEAIAVLREFEQSCEDQIEDFVQ